MNRTAEAIVGAVGETYQENPNRIVGPRPSLVRHYVLNFHEIATGRFRNVPVGAGALVLLSTFPVILEIDGEPFVADEDVPLISNAGLLQGFNPSYDPGSLGNVIFARPSIAFTLRRKIKTLSVLVSGSTTDYTNGTVPGTCHLWVGPDDVEDMGFGLPVSHTLQQAIVAALGLTAGFTFTCNLHGGIAALTSGIEWFASRTEVNGALVEIGGGGNITRALFYMDGAGADRFFLAEYTPNVASPWDFDFGVPLEIPSYQTRAFNADGRGPLGVEITSSIAMTSLRIVLRCKSYM